MRVSATAAALHLPFVGAFSHAAAERSRSSSIVVRLQTDDGTVGFGEGCPREYVTGETMPQWKESGRLAYSQVPLLVDGDLELVQSGAISRYLARKYDLYGDLQQGTVAEMLMDGWTDLLGKVIPLIFPIKKVRPLRIDAGIESAAAVSSGYGSYARTGGRTCCVCQGCRPGETW